MPVRDGAPNEDGGREISLRFLCPAFLILLAACVPVVRPTIKIGLVAPFEGRYRDLGYEVIFAVRLAVREANRVGGVAGYSIDLISLDDSGDEAMAVEQARKLATDPQLVGAIGHWLDATTLAAAPEYERAGVALVATAASGDLPGTAFRLWPRSACQLPTSDGCARAPGDLRLTAADGITVRLPAPLPVDSADPAFADRYRAISNGVEPGAYATLAYDAARLMFAAIAHDVARNGAPTRAGVGRALAVMSFDGLSGPIAFDSDRNWVKADGWEYVWRAGAFAAP